MRRHHTPLLDLLRSDGVLKQTSGTISVIR